MFCREENNDLPSLMVSPKVHAFVSVLSVNECLQHSMLGFANGTTVRQLCALPGKLGIRDHKDASSEGPEDGSHMVQSQGCMMDVQDSLIQIAATRLSSINFMFSPCIFKSITFIFRLMHLIV